ncbi:hypothetical protein [Luteolibacter soli]|uniref:DUF4375 domain-containing protein n=1 Tax=Luteolibacter soli TaxID=3135280 RepID=A0ABU9AX62_9BACT
MKWPWLLAGSVVAGIAIGWSTGHGPPSPAGTSAQKSARDAPHQPWTKEDFLKSANKQASAALEGTTNPYREFLATWTTEEIRAALDTSLTQPDCVLPSGSSSALPGRILGEWLHRDLKSALAWFDALASTTAKQRLAPALCQQWPDDKTAEGLAFLQAHRDLYRAGTGLAFVEKSFDQAAATSPADVAQLLLLCHQEQLHGGRNVSIEFPKRFDFTLLLATDEWQQLGDDPLANSVISAWQARDPDLAFDWMLGQHGAKSLVQLADNAIASGGDGPKWLAEKIEDLPDTDQRAFLDAARQDWIGTPSRLAALSLGLHDPLLLDEIASWAAQSMFRDIEGALPVIEQIPGIERRIELLESAEPDEAAIRTPGLRSFDAYDEALLRKTLASWDVAEPHIEAIISRYRP